MRIFVSFILLLYPIISFGFAYPYERMEYVAELTKAHQSLKIIKQTNLNPQDKIFKTSYWKVYYQKDKIVGEELFVNGKMTYYYVYFYTPEKIYQKGFFWYGIYTKPYSVKLSGQDIKMGFIYKNIPDTYQVYNAITLERTYSYTYPNKEI